MVTVFEVMILQYLNHIRLGLAAVECDFITDIRQLVGHIRFIYQTTF
jgi:hypothetical protein